MRKTVCVVMILLVMSIFISCGQPSPGVDNPSNTLSIDLTVKSSAVGTQRLEDLEFLCANLEEKHIDLYHSISKEEFLAEKVKIAAKISTLDDNEFFCEMKRLLALIGDAHTDISFSDSSWEQLRFLPIQLIKIGENWHIGSIDKAHGEYIGYQVVAMNGLSIEEIFTRAGQVISHNNEGRLDTVFSSMLPIDILKFLQIADRLDAITITVKDMETDEEMDLEINSVPGKEYINIKMEHIQSKTVPKTKPESIYRSMELDKATYFIQYNACIVDNALPMGKFVERVHADLTSTHYDKVIVDLRVNYGGDVSIFKPVIDMLSELQKTTPFQVYTLIGPATYGEAVGNAIELKTATDCILVGLPTGSNVNTYGAERSFELANFPAIIYYPTQYIEYMPGYDQGALRPDVPVSVTYEDAMEGVDTVVEEILKR